MSVFNEVAKIKTKLKEKAKKKGIYENFGQKEVLALSEKYGYSPTVQDFDIWCQNYTGKED